MMKRSKYQAPIAYLALPKSRKQVYMLTKNEGFLLEDNIIDQKLAAPFVQ